MMKKYEELKWTIILFEEDVITASGDDDEGMFRTDIFG